VTMNEVHFARGNNRLAAAKNARSAVVSGGRPIRRRKTGQLVAKHDDLQHLQVIGTKPEDHELQNALKRDVADRQEHDASVEEDEERRHSTQIDLKHPTDGIIRELRSLGYRVELANSNRSYATT